MVAILQHERVREHILGGLGKGNWSTGDNILSDIGRVAMCIESRMTVSRAVKLLYPKQQFRLDTRSSYRAREIQKRNAVRQAIPQTDVKGV